MLASRQVEAQVFLSISMNACVYNLQEQLVISMQSSIDAGDVEPTDGTSDTINNMQAPNSLTDNCPQHPVLNIGSGSKHARRLNQLWRWGIGWNCGKSQREGLGGPFDEWEGVFRDRRRNRSSQILWASTTTSSSSVRLEAAAKAYNFVAPQKAPGLGF
eukprot:Gb_16487 [translate_table: standard]